MGGGGFGAGLGNADLENDHGLDRSRLFGHAQELVSFFDALQITGDDVGLLVFRQRLDEIHFIQVSLVSEADDLRQAKLLLRRPIQDGHTQRARTAK